MQFDWVIAGQVLWGLYLVVWSLIRWVPNRRARKTKIAFSTRPMGEIIGGFCSWLGLLIVPLAWVVTGWPSSFDRPIGPISLIIGLVIAIAALRLFRITHKALGAMWSDRLDLREDHKLVTHGIYERLRHPMYSAFWLWAASQPFFLANWVAGLAGLVGFGALFFLRIGSEERMMEERFGDEYREYCKRSSRIIPGVY